MSAVRSFCSILSLFALLLVAVPAAAEEYRCVGNRIEKGSSTWGAYQLAGSDYRIEKSSSSIGWAKQAGSDWRIETFGGSSLGWLKGDRIEKFSGQSWTRLDTATAFCACPPPVAAAMWILQQQGSL